jgi:hypothetical protein
MAMSTRYRSKVDSWLIASVIIVAVAHAWAAAVLINAADFNAIAIFIPIAIVGLGLPVWILVGTHYTLSPASLEVCCGPFRYQVPIDRIKEIRPSRSMLSSPAPSLDRLEIIYGNNESVLISPLHREKFLAELESLKQHAR